MSDKWKLNMVAEPLVPAWTSVSYCGTNGSELQRAIIKGFGANKTDPVWSNHEPFTFEMVFTFAEHGEFFRGALTMAGLRYTGDFYDLLQRYGKIKVTITKFKESGEDL